MLVCWEWLSQYVKLSTDADSLANRFAMTGLNHESTEMVGNDTVIDLEVTSNRGDCLGHIGVAREAAVLLNETLCIPEPKFDESSESIATAIRLQNTAPEACERYTARVIRGAKIGPSPEWLRRRLAAIGIKSINNVVDVTNYVMMECGQPLHAFDLAQIQGAQVIVRLAAKGEKFVAIDHNTYILDEQMLVIADKARPVAIAGVMGGVDSEVSESTTDLLIESAAFAPLSVRRTARRLKLQSASSFRFERRPDPAAVDWASRRCCQLITQIAGGTVCSGVAESSPAKIQIATIQFRMNQVERILGIGIAASEVKQILEALGCRVTIGDAQTLSVTPPSWRADLTREIDLIEEVARINGYEKIPEDVSVPIGVAVVRPKDLALDRIRHVLSAYGIDEAMTPSVVTEKLESCGSVWTDSAPLATETPLLIGSRLLRRSLLPSLLAARQGNQAQSIRDAQLYEIANIVLPAKQASDLPREQSTLGIVATPDLQQLRGAVEELLLQTAGRNTGFVWIAEDHPLYAPGSSNKIADGNEVVGWMGMVNPQVLRTLGLDSPCAAAELNIDAISSRLVEVRRADPVSPYPGMQRDLNFVVNESLRWEELSNVCYQMGGDSLQDVVYRETYRDAKKDGPGLKRVLMTLFFQRLDRTLTSDEVDAAIAKVVSEMSTQLNAKLLG